jgi:acyl-CoA synthetase (AMP-forming)/AMP-acid ligase II
MVWFSPERELLLPEIIALNGRWLRSKPAVIAGGTTISWTEFDRRTAQVANGLIDAGLEKGDRVVLLMRNSLEMAEAIFGPLRAGLTVVPLNVSITDEAVRTMIFDSGARAVIASDEHIGRIQGIRAGLPTDLAGRYFAVNPEGPREREWREFGALRDAADSAPPGVNVAAGDSCNIIYSSGTTGLPKGIVHSHACRMAWAYDMAIALRYHAGARTLLPLGMFSNITWVAMLSTVLVGGTLVIRARFEQQDCLQVMQDERVTHFAMVPLLYQRLLEYERFSDYDLTSLQAYMCCGSPLSVQMKKEITERMPGDLIELYGLTEGLVTILAPEDLGERIASVGRPCPGQNLRIVDNDGNELPPGESGEIVGSSRLMMSGYHGNDRATEAATWLHPSGGRWLCTGDIGRLDEDGFLYLVDRKKDMIISGGQNVYPADIEAVVLAHEAVSETAVIGVASRKWGETPVAIVVGRSGNSIDADEITAWASSRLGKQQRIAATIIVDELPRNPNGKILKRELRTRFAELEF